MVVSDNLKSGVTNACFYASTNQRLTASAPRWRPLRQRQHAAAQVARQGKNSAALLFARPSTATPDSLVLQFELVCAGFLPKIPRFAPSRDIYACSLRLRSE